MRAIEQIIEQAGGRPAIGRRVGLRWGVHKWPENGIPERHWPVLMELVPDLTADELVAANAAARQRAA